MEAALVKVAVASLAEATLEVVAVAYLVVEVVKGMGRGTWCIQSMR